MAEDTVTGTISVLGIDFGIKVFATCSDGMTFHVEPPWTFDAAAVVIAKLCEYAAKFDLIVIEGLKGGDLNSHNIKWFKASMKRRYPNVRVKRADHNFPSSRLCNECTSVNTHFKDRWVKCDSCGHLADRDVNAAKNLRDWLGPKFSAYDISSRTKESDPWR